jgi:glycosyltransferase involved in cell wall biosynthesis
MKRLYGSADRAAIRSASRVITINASNVGRFSAIYGIEPQVIYWGYDSGFWRRAPEPAIREWRARWGPGPLLLHSTDLSGIKGSFELLSVVEQLALTLTDVKLLVTVYLDNEAARAHFDAEIRSRALGGHVEVLGRVDRDALPLAYSAVDAVVQPGTQPANGALREALLCETPIVGGTASEEVEEGVNGVRVDVRDPRGAAARVEWLLSHRSALDLDIRGRRKIEAQFPLTSSIRDFRDVLAAAADTSRQTDPRGAPATGEPREASGRNTGET